MPSNLLDPPKLTLVQSLLAASEWLRQLAEDLSTGKAEEVPERNALYGQVFRHFTYKKIAVQTFLGFPTGSTEIVEGPAAEECIHHFGCWAVMVKVADCIKEGKRYVLGMQARKD